MSEQQTTVTVDGVAVALTTLPFAGGVANAEATTTRDPISGAGLSVTPSATAGTSAACVHRLDGTEIAADGVDGTGITPPTGGSGIRGWLSGSYSVLGQILTTLGGTIKMIVQGVSGTLQASAAQSASANGGTTLNTLNMRDLLLFLNISAVSASGGTLQVFVQSQDPVSAQWADVSDFGQIGYDGTNLTVNQTNVPLNTPIALCLGANALSKALIGSAVRLRWEVNGATFTFSVGYVGK